MKIDSWLQVEWAGQVGWLVMELIYRCICQCTQEVLFRHRHARLELFPRTLHQEVNRMQEIVPLFPRRNPVFPDLLRRLYDVLQVCECEENMYLIWDRLRSALAFTTTKFEIRATSPIIIYPSNTSNLITRIYSLVLRKMEVILLVIDPT